MRNDLLVYVVFACSIYCGATERALADRLRTVALTGNVATGSDARFRFFSDPVLNDIGHAAFLAGLTGTGIVGANNLGIWSEGGGGGLKLVLRKGDPAPGTSAKFGSTIISSTPSLNGSGRLAFGGVITGVGVNNTNNSGIWSVGGGSGLELVARTGSVAPGTNAKFSHLSSPVLNDGGQIAINGTITGSGVASTNDFGIWSEGESSGLKLVARTGGRFSFLSGPTLNAVGQTAFVGHGSGIYTARSGSGLKLEVHSETTAPGTSSRFGRFLAVALNDSGKIAFKAILGGAGAKPFNDEGIWSDSRGFGMELIARKGDPAPDTNERFAFVDFPRLNNRGQLAFRGGITGQGSNAGIWSNGGGDGLKVVARSGDAAPGTDGFFSFIYSPTLNERGQTAFRSEITGSGIGRANRSGIWAEDRAGNLHLIARIGDLLDVSDDILQTDLREIKSLGFPNGSSSVFNNLGQLAFRAEFIDGSSGIFVSSLVAVPEPASLRILCICLALSLGGGRRKHQAQKGKRGHERSRGQAC